jgi:hypothetical protein
MNLRLLPTLAALAAGLNLAASAALPVQNEQVVVTCFSGGYSSYTAPASALPNNGPNGFVVAIFNTTSGTIAPLIPPTTSSPVLWTGPASAGNHNEPNPGLEWTSSRLGEVFGITLDDLSPPNIYVAASDCYNVIGAPASLNVSAPTGPGGIYRLDANNGAILSGNLPAVGGNTPGSGPGLGNLCFYRAANNSGFLYISNLDDGLIYRVDPTTMTAVGAPYDHGVQGRPQESLSQIADNSGAGLTPYGRRVWGVKTWQNRLFYAVWWEDGRNVNPGESNEIWSVDLDNAGNFLPSTARRRITLPNYPDTSAGLWSNPIASIDFSPAGVMFLAERYWQLNPIVGNATYQFGPHYCRLHRYTLSGPNWVTTPSTTHHVGGNATPYFLVPPYAIVGANSAGGVAVNCDESVWATGDFFNGYSVVDSTTNASIGSPYLYGAVRIQTGGNVGLPYGRGGFVIDYDGAFGVSKVAIGAITTRRECCMLLAASNVQCPPVPGGPYSVDVTVTNLMAAPITTLQFAPCPNNQLPPGATTLTPSPSQITLGSPIPQNGSASVTLALPNLPPVGGTVCFLVNVVDTSNPAEPHIICSQKICVNLPHCPCAELTATNLQCPPCIGQPHTLDLIIKNIWNAPYSWYSLVPCPPSELPPGAAPVVPAPAGLQPFSPPLQPNSTITVPVTLQGVPLTGGLACFTVRFYGALENQLLCEEKICVTFPACSPSPGMTLTQVGQILCPQYPGGPFKLTFTITNTQPVPAYGATIGPCSGPGGGPFFGVTPGLVTFSPLLVQNQTTTVTVCLNGLSPEEMGCLCVQFLDQNQRPFCLGQLCFTLPPCPPGDPPCLHLDAVDIHCPVGTTGYTFTLNLTNNSGTTASWYQLCPVPPVDLPLGAVTGQPSPAGLVPFNPPVPGTGGTAVIPNIQLPTTVPEGANFCFLVKIYTGAEQLICTELFCVQLPRCSCATVTADVVCVPPFPNRQVTFNVTNNTNVVGTPFNFAQAVVIPTMGFSPSTMIASPNPIVPGGSGTFTTTFTGTKPPLCVMLLLFNENRTRCCRVRVCPLWVECDPGPPKDICDLPSELVSEANGNVNYTAWITNLSLTQTKTYSWTLMPATVPGCTGTLPGNAFTPVTGTTGPVGPGSAQGVSFSVNASSLAPGNCAGFKICFVEISPAYNEPVCCYSVVRRLRPTDPCVVLNPTGRAIPVVAGDLGIIIKNPTPVPLDMDVIVFDTGGQTSFTFNGPPWPTDPGDICQRIVAAPGESAQMIMTANIAPGVDVNGLPAAVTPGLVELIWLRLCNNAQGYEILGTQSHFRPGGDAPFDFPPPGGPRVLPVSGLMFTNDATQRSVRFTMPSEPGAEYHAFSATDLTLLGGPGGFRLWPNPGYRLLQAADGTFLGQDGVMTLDLPGTVGAPREFFKVQTATPVFAPP